MSHKVTKREALHKNDEYIFNSLGIDLKKLSRIIIKNVQKTYMFIWRSYFNY